MGALVTGLGSVCALGRGIDALWSGIESGRDGFTEIDRFSTLGMKSKLGGMVPDRNTRAVGQNPVWDLNIEFAIDSGREALAQSGLNHSGMARDRIALVLGTSMGDFAMPLHKMTEAVAAALDIRGPAITVSTACTSSTNALGLALDLLRQGFADAVVAGGSDVLTPIMLAGFNALGVLSEGKCSPFSLPYGTTLGEGAGFIVLENEATARGSETTIHGVIAGYGLSADAYHETSPDPTGAGVARAVTAALTDADIPPTKIAYANVHGTGTSANDPAEWKALQSVFGPAAETLPISSTKSFFGHAQGAAGVLEIIVTLLSMKNQVVPPTLHSTTARKNGPPDPVFSLKPRPHRYEYAICTNSAFGGANAAVVVGAPWVSAKWQVARPKKIRIIGVGGLAAHGLSMDDLLPAMSEGRLLNCGRVPDFSAAELLPGVDPRRLDPSSRFLTVAARLALTDAGLETRRSRRDRVGLIMGINAASPESARALHESITKNGLPLLSATSFPRMVLNAPLGTCSKLLSLGGPLSTLSTGEGSGLVAIVYAADHLRNRTDVDLLVAGGLDERDSELGEGGEGAACAVLAVASNPKVDDIFVAGWGLAGPGNVLEAGRSALRSAKMEPSSVDAVFGCGLEGIISPSLRWNPDSALGHGSAFSSATAFVAAVAWLRGGYGKTVLVADGKGQSAVAAVVLTRGDLGGN